jgi:hypothetical protein
MDYAEGAAVPPGYRVEKRMRRGAVLAGSIIAGICNE